MQSKQSIFHISFGSIKLGGFKCSAPLICAALILAACASDVANRYYSGTKFSPVPVSQVDLLWEKPSRPFEVIADFQSRGETPDDMRKKAAMIGADAVIVSILGGDYSLSEEWADKDRHSNSYTRITGTAIRYSK